MFATDVIKSLKDIIKAIYFKNVVTLVVMLLCCHHVDDAVYCSYRNAYLA